MANALHINKMKDTHAPLSNPFTTRRPRSVVEEMIPMLDSRRGTFLGVKDTFEFTMRDSTDATAKRGFRVQVPKRMLSYVLLVFFILPLLLFLYVEVHKAQQKRHVARYHAPPVPNAFPRLSFDPENMTMTESVAQIMNEVAVLTTDTIDQIGADLLTLTVPTTGDDKASITTELAPTALESSNLTSKSAAFLWESENITASSITTVDLNDTSAELADPSARYRFLRKEVVLRNQ